MKCDTCTDPVAVDAADVSGTVARLTLGGLTTGCPSATGAVRSRERLSEVSRRDSRRRHRSLKGGTWQTVSRRCAWRAIDALNPVLRGWARYLNLANAKTALQEIDDWLRRKRRWERPHTRERQLRQFGLSAERVWKSAVNGQEPWEWNGGASQIYQQPCRNPAFVDSGWCPYLPRYCGSSVCNEPPYTGPYVRWCGTTAGMTQPPTQSSDMPRCTMNCTKKGGLKPSFSHMM